MESSALLLILAFGFILNAIVLYYLIRSATEVTKRTMYDEIKIRLLIRIARANGVSEEEIEVAKNG